MAGDTAPMNLRCQAMRAILTTLCVLAVFCTPPPARSQDQEEIKGAPAEPADAQEIRSQIAAV
jgi:hypothetical protein